MITKRLLSQLYGQTDAALASLSSTLLARQDRFFLFPLQLFAKGSLLFCTFTGKPHYARNFFRLCLRLTLDSHSSGLRNFPLILETYLQGPHYLGAVSGDQGAQPHPSRANCQREAKGEESPLSSPSHGCALPPDGEEELVQR